MAPASLTLRADSVVVFNEIMYHPQTNEAVSEWVELHNQMAVDVDLSAWSLAGGIDYTFPEGTSVAGGGYLVVASSPATLMAATRLTNVLGPFTGRLSNAGDKLRLLNNNQRLMDTVSYGVEDDWPVAPDGSGVSLAKRDEDSASAAPASWVASAQVGGTPGRRNFPLAAFEVTHATAVAISAAWRYDTSLAEPSPNWRQAGFDDHAWLSGQGLFEAGKFATPLGNAEALGTVFSTGLDSNGSVIIAGLPDPHYLLLFSAQSRPPPPPIPATVIQSNPAWQANDSGSSWIGPVNPGTSGAAPGPYTYRTGFTLDGYEPTTAALTLSLAVDNRLTNVFLNGNALGTTYAGFKPLSGDFVFTNGFLPGTNTLDFFTVNDDVTANPAGFRARLSGVARKRLLIHTALPTNGSSYRFRAGFAVDGPPAQVALSLSAVVADGAAFYLNGTEVLRLNMPTGPITNSTLALSNVVAPADLGPFLLPTASLVAGANVLAVEVHPAAGGQEVLFGAELSLTATNFLAPPPVAVAFNELATATNADFWFELINYGSSAVNLGGYVLARQGGATNREYTFPPAMLAPGGMLQVTKADLGFGADPGDRLFLLTPDRTSVPDAVVAKSRPRARWPDGVGEWRYPLAPTPGSSNQFAFQHDIVINEIMYDAPGLPSIPGAFSTNLLIGITNVWKYNSQGTDEDASWSDPAYDDSLWGAGRGLFYNTGSALPAPKNTSIPLSTNGAPIITWYFRTPFVFQGEAGTAQLSLRPIVDDGAVFYLNGVEVLRINMPDGPISYTNRAAKGVATAAYTGPYPFLVNNLVSGTNVLAVEVHQFSTNLIGYDVVFGAELVVTEAWVPPVPARASPESWVELFNRGSKAVDLTGWRLAGDLDYTFAPGASLPAGSYLVVAGDVGYMQSNYTGLSLAGPFTNHLHHSCSHVLLKDAAGNPASEVRFFDGSPWPEYAAGGGSSLELRDPWADNSKPEAWAASIESGRAGWSNYTYRAVAANLLGPTQWNEFVLGLLDAGECLIDDLHVVESPGTAPVELLQNGSFETGLTAWRALGDHSRSRVEEDPDSPGNHVLHVVATGPTDHLHNHLETTYAGGRALVDGREYQISFRAKWVAGNSHLNTRLYFNRVARTAVLPMPARHGTPGAPNSTVVPNLGPTLTAFGHSPIVPQANEPVTVRVSASDPQGVSSVTLWWAPDGGSWSTLPMLRGVTSAEPGYAGYSAMLPAQPAGALVQFFVQAADNLGALSTYPANGTNSRAFFKVDDGQPAMSGLHRIRLLTSASDAALLHAPTNVMSNDRIGLTVVNDERQVFYDTGVHLQSSERGRNDPSRAGFTVHFHADQLFRGVQSTITMDRSGGQSGLGGRHDEILLWHAVNHAGGLPGLNNDLVQVFAPRSQENSTGMLRMSAFDADYFDSLLDHGSDGNLYKLELIYYPQTTLTGDPQSPKLPQPDQVINVEFQDWGDDPEAYRWIFLQENHADDDDYGGVMALNKALGVTGAGQEAAVAQVMDADEWLRTLAFKDLTGDVDTYTHGLNHNFKFYFRPTDGKAMGLLWDMDYSFVTAIDSAFPGSGSPNTYRWATLPNNYRRYCNHLWELTTTSMNAAYLRPWAARYAGLVGEDWSGAVNYIQQRADFVRAALPLDASFGITNHGGANFSVTNSTIALSGTAPISVRDIEVNGLVYPVRWTSLTNWVVTVPLASRVNQLSVQGLDNYSHPLSNAQSSITVTNLGQPALRPVVINEWMAANAGPGGCPDPLDQKFQDWFELYNPNSLPVDLSGSSLTDTLSEPAKWRIPANTMIPARGFLLVWADNETNQNGLSATGDLHANFQLNNGGEALGLYAADGAPQHTLVFGPQPQNVSQGLFPDGNTNTVCWMTNWTPRASNVLSALSAPQVSSLTLSPAGVLAIQVLGVAGRVYRLEFKEDLKSLAWLPLAPTRSPGAALTLTDTTLGHPQRFYRVVLLQ